MREKGNWKKTRHFIWNDWKSDDSYGRFAFMTVLLTYNCDYRRRMMPASDECRMHVINAECNWRMWLSSVTTSHCQWQMPSATECSVADEGQRQLKQVTFKLQKLIWSLFQKTRKTALNSRFVIMAQQYCTRIVDDNTTYISLWLMPETDGWQLQWLLSATHDYECWPRHWSTTNSLMSDKGQRNLKENKEFHLKIRKNTWQLCTGLTYYCWLRQINTKGKYNKFLRFLLMKDKGHWKKTIHFIWNHWKVDRVLRRFNDISSWQLCTL